MLENEIITRLKDQFSVDQIRDIAFCIDPNTDNIKKAISDLLNIDDNLADFYIDKKAEEITEFLNSMHEYYCSEEWLSEYFIDYDNSEVQINYSDYQSENERLHGRAKSHRFQLA